MVKAIKKRWIRMLMGIQRDARKKSCARAVAEAKKINAETDKKVLIYFVKGEYHALTKQEMKAKWKDKQFIGYTVQELENAAEIKVESYATRKTVNK